jgi:hypothetical protein
MKPTYFLQLTNGDQLPETEDLLRLFQEARALNKDVLPPVTAAIFQVGADEKGKRKLIPIATFGTYRISRRGRPTREASHQLEEPNDFDQEHDPFGDAGDLG